MIINRKKSVHKKNSIDEYKLSKKKKKSKKQRIKAWSPNEQVEIVKRLTKKKKIAFQKVRQRIFWTCNQTYKKQEYKRPQNERQPMFQSKKIKASKQGGNC